MNIFADIFPNFDRFLLVLTPAVFGIICHEVAHGYAAYLQGDPTAKALGRLTLNPVKHIDPTGTMVFVLTAMFSPFVFGWAKPVPVHAGYFRSPRQGMMLVAAAGPLANFTVALVCACIVVALDAYNPASFSALPPWLGYVASSAHAGIGINCALAWFNLMPIPPLDGSHIVGGVLPAPLARMYAEIGRYGMLILLALLYFKLLTPVLWPLINASAQTIVTMARFIF